MLLTHGIEVLGVHCASGVHGHAHTQKARHGTGRIAGGGLHGVGLGAHQSGCRHGGVPEDGGALSLLDHLGVFLRQGDRAQGNAHHFQTPEGSPLLRQCGVHGVFQVGIVGHNLVGPQLQLRQPSEGGLQGADKLGFQLAVQLIPGIVPFHVAADVGIEQQGVGNLIGVDAGAAHRHIHIQADFGVHHPEGDGVGGAELVVQQLLGIDVVHPLVLTGVAAVSKPLADGFEGLQDALAQRAGEDGGFGGGIIGKLTRLGADLHDLALLHNEHTLTVCHGNAGAVGDNVVASLGVGGAAAGALDALGDQKLLGHGLTVEELFPLVCQHSAHASHCGFHQSHRYFSFRLGSFAQFSHSLYHSFFSFATPFLKYREIYKLFMGYSASVIIFLPK